MNHKFTGLLPTPNLLISKQITQHPGNPEPTTKRAAGNAGLSTTANDSVRPTAFCERTRIPLVGFHPF